MCVCVVAGWPTGGALMADIITDINTSLRAGTDVRAIYTLAGVSGINRSAAHAQPALGTRMCTGARPLQFVGILLLFNVLATSASFSFFSFFLLFALTVIRFHGNSNRS